MNTDAATCVGLLLSQGFPEAAASVLWGPTNQPNCMICGLVNLICSAMCTTKVLCPLSYRVCTERQLNGVSGRHAS